MNKSNGLCKLCNTQNETLCHLFVECCKISDIWTKVHNIIVNVTGENFAMSKTNIMLGYNNVIITNVNTRIMYNYFVYITKWLLWKHRNNVKFGTSALKTVDFIYEETIKCCKLEAQNIKNGHKWKKCNDGLQGMLSKTTELAT